MNVKPGESANLVARTQDFISESVNELKKVSRPTRAEAMQATIVTIVIMLFVAICLFVLDVIFGRVMAAILA